jgi:hypothetical protein
MAKLALARVLPYSVPVPALKRFPGCAILQDGDT